MSRGATDRAFAEEREYSVRQRTALVVWHLALGEGMRLEDVEALTAMSREGARDLLDDISLAIPIYRDENGVWQECSFKEIAF